MSDNTFTLRIELGSSAMQDRRDVANALHSVAEAITTFRHFLDGDSGKIRDVNGNTVGQWTFTTELTTDICGIDLDDVAYEDADQRYGGNDNPYMED